MKPERTCSQPGSALSSWHAEEKQGADEVGLYARAPRAASGMAEEAPGGTTAMVEFLTAFPRLVPTGKMVDWMHEQHSAPRHPKTLIRGLLCRSKSCSFNARATFRPNGTDLFRGLHVGPCHRASVHKQHSARRQPKTLSRGLYVGPCHTASVHEQHSVPRKPKTFSRGPYVGPSHRASMHEQHSIPRKPKTFSRGPYVGPSHRASMHEQHSAPRQPKMKLAEVLLYVHRNRRLILGREPRTATSTFAQLLSSATKDPQPWTSCRSMPYSFNAWTAFRPKGTNAFRGLYVGPCHRDSVHEQHSARRKPKTFSRGLYVCPSHTADRSALCSMPSACWRQRRCVDRRPADKWVATVESSLPVLFVLLLTVWMMASSNTKWIVHPSVFVWLCEMWVVTVVVVGGGGGGGGVDGLGVSERLARWQKVTKWLVGFFLEVQPRVIMLSYTIVPSVHAQ